MSEAMVTKTLHYYPPHSVGGMKGVMWCAEVPGREAVWSRQLCVALKLSRRDPKAVKPQQLNLFDQ